MKTREEILNLIDVILHQEKYSRYSYEVGRLKYRDYQRERHYLAMKLDSLLWVLGVRNCYFRAMTIEETFNVAQSIVNFNPVDGATELEELPFN